MLAISGGNVVLRRQGAQAPRPLMLRHGGPGDTRRRSLLLGAGALRLTPEGTEVGILPPVPPLAADDVLSKPAKP